MKDIADFNGIYAISENGEIWSYGGVIGSARTGKFLKPSKDKDGYRRITLKNRKMGLVKYKRIARLMLETFRPFEDMNKYQVNHINGLKDDDRLDNLEWVTASENIIHSFTQLGKNQKCSKNNCFKVWGFYDKNENMQIFKNKSVDTWCKENNVYSSVIYPSMKEKTKIKKGKLMGFRFFRFNDEFGSTDK